MKRILKNILWGFGGQLLVLAISILLPRVILISFGSEVNGITATISQIFVYIALLEAGIGNASKNCLYKKIAQSDRVGISEAVSATRKYFRKIIPIYAMCVVLLAIVFPHIIKTDISVKTVRSIILIQGLSGVVNFHFTNTYTQLLVADGRNYVVSNLALLVKALSTIVQILLISAGYDIISVQLSLLCAYIIKAVIISIYVKKQYPWLTYEPTADTNMLEQRGSFVVHEISTVVFQSTDVLLISLFCSVKEASVYSIYNMVFSALSSINAILFKSIDFDLGAEFHRSRDNYIRIHDLYDTIYSCFVFAIISAAVVVIQPFVKLYTQGITDINYIQPILPILFSLIHLLSCSRAVASKLITISGRAKNTIPNSIIETVINIIASVVLVNILGMPGVLIGTIIALLYRTNDIILYANLKILNRHPGFAFKTLTINLFLFVLTVIFTVKCPLVVDSYLRFFTYGIFVLIAEITLFFGVQVILNPSFRNVIKRVYNKLTQRHVDNEK